MGWCFDRRFVVRFLEGLFDFEVWDVFEQVDRMGFEVWRWI